MSDFPLFVDARVLHFNIRGCWYHIFYKENLVSATEVNLFNFYSECNSQLMNETFRYVLNNVANLKVYYYKKKTIS